MEFSPQATTYETVLRFECKMALQYVPNFNRFVFDDLTTKYYSSCQFEVSVIANHPVGLRTSSYLPPEVAWIRNATDTKPKPQF